jgi:fructuronate reductase
VTTTVTETRARLSAATVGRARALTRPGYDRTATPCITHIGVGAFVRAHLAVYADEMLQSGHDALIRGVSLHSTQPQEQLAPQDGYYSVLEREPGVAPRLRVVGSVASVTAGTGPALATLTAPTTQLVTLTITEKGYDLDPADLAHPERPVSAPGLLALALQRWRTSSLEPPVVAALDNVSANGTLLRSRVLEVAGRLEPDLPRWIEDTVPFPDSVVDRMVPAVSPRDLEEVSSRLGLVDLGAVVTERHRSWVTTGHPRLEPWTAVGVELVTDTTPYEQRKLWLLNGPHSALAYGGLVAGHATIASAATDGKLGEFVGGLVDDVLEVVHLPHALAPSDFAADALGRFKNPGLAHTCAQVGADGSRKLPQRFADVVAARLERGLDVTRFATVVALWIAAAAGIELRGARLPALEDPDAADLRRRRSEGSDGVVGAALDGRFAPGFVAAVRPALRDLIARGAGVLAEPT